MLALSRWKIVLVLASAIFGLIFTLPNLLPDQALDEVPAWLPHDRLSLGLDLRGGSYLLMEVDTKALNKERLNNLTEDVRTKLRVAQINFDNLGLNGEVVDVHVPDAAQFQQAFKLLANQIGGQLKNGGRDVSVAQETGQVIEVAYVPQAGKDAAEDAVTRSIEIIRKRIDALGATNPSITRQGANRIVIEAPGQSDPERLKAIIGKTAKLTFQLVDDSISADDLKAGRIPPDDEMLPSDVPGREYFVIKRRVMVDGGMLTNAEAGHDQDGGPDINFAFNGIGAQRFGEATSENVHKPFAIVIDNRVISAPVIDGPIMGGSGLIHGSFTEESAHDLALVLKTGALPAPLNMIEQRTVGAELGADAVKAGQISILIGAALILVFILLAYGLFGGFAAVALAVNGLMIVGIMSLFHATLTLPGVAGLLLTLAVAVDANVLIYERMRDEARSGRPAMAAADAGFSRAMTTIIDANVTTVVAAVIMFGLGAGGPVKGFALTLLIGVLTSVFTAVLITQVLIGWWFRATRAKKLPIV